MESNAPSAGSQATNTPQTTEANTQSNPGIAGSAAAKEGQAPNAVKEAAQEAKRRLKIDNEEVDEDEVIKTYKSRKEHQREANKRFQEGLALRKQAEQFVSMLKDPEKAFDVLKKVGHDEDKLRKLMEQKLTEKIKYDMLDDREKELLRLKQENEQFKEFEKKQKEEVERQRHEAMKKKFSEEYSQQFVDVLKKEKIPANKATVAEMAKYIQWAAKRGFDMTVPEAAKLVKEDLESRVKQVIGDSDAELLIKLLGEENIQKIRAHDVAKLRSPDQFLRTPQEQGEAQRRRSSDQKRMTPQEWRKHKFGL